MKNKFNAFMMLVVRLWLTTSAIGYVLFAVLFASCQSQLKNKVNDTPTSGCIHFACEESHRLIIETELAVFHAIYQNAQLLPHYYDEETLFKQLYSDSMKLGVASRMLNNKEIAFFNQKKIFPHQVKIASDAIAVLLHNENVDTLFTVKELAGVFKGTINQWQQLRSHGSRDSIEIVVESAHSGIIRYIIDSVALTKKTSAKFHFAASELEVIKYVSNNRNSLGLVGVGWISDRDDSTCLSFDKSIRVATIAANENSRGYKPFQAFIATQQYPLCRSIYLISTDPHLGLAAGFQSFVASDKGQRIILKSGLVPAIAPIRLIQVRNE